MDRRGLAWLIWPVAAAVTIAAQWPWLNLADDIRFTFGALRSTELAHPALEVFAHRPMANRLVMAGLDALTGGPLQLREKFLMSWGVVAVAGAAALLHAALRRRTGAGVAMVTALAVFGSLAWASEPYTLQPEWTATVLGVAALGLALRPGRHRGPLLGAAVLLAVAILQKYTTVSVAGLVLVGVWAVDRRRALTLAVLGAVVTVVLFGVSLLVGTHEWQWFRETPALNPAVGLRWDAFAEWAVNVGFNNPILLLWPAGAALAATLSGRRVWVGASLVGFAGVLAVIVVQNQFFSYHGTPLLPVAAGVSAYAVASWVQRTGRPLYGLAPLVGWVVAAEVVIRLPATVRSDARVVVGWCLLLVVALVSGLVWAQQASWSGHQPAVLRRSTRIGVAVALAVVITFPAWPSTPYGLFGLDRSRRSEIERQHDLMAEAAGIRAVVGEAPVSYLADGETVYMVGSRTPCRYPAAVVLYRSQDPAVGRLSSFAENLACLSEPSVRFLVWQVWRVPFDEVDPRIRQTVEATYDCDRGTRVGEVLVCPRR